MGEKTRRRPRVVQVVVSLPRADVAAMDRVLVTIRLKHRVTITRSQLIAAVLEVAINSATVLGDCNSANDLTTRAAAIFGRS